MPSLLPNFLEKKIPREIRQEQLGKCPSERAADACVFPSRRGKNIQQNICEFIWKGSESPW